MNWLKKKLQRPKLVWSLLSFLLLAVSASSYAVSVSTSDKHEIETPDSPSKVEKVNPPSSQQELNNKPEFCELSEHKEPICIEAKDSSSIEPKVCCSLLQTQTKNPIVIADAIEKFALEVASQSTEPALPVSLEHLWKINACAQLAIRSKADSIQGNQLKKQGRIIAELLLKLKAAVPKITEVMKGCDADGPGDEDKNRSVVTGNGVAYVASAKALGVKGEVSHSSLLTELVLNGSKTAQVAGQCVQRVVGAVEETLGAGQEWCQGVDKRVKENNPPLKAANQEPVKPRERIGDKGYCESTLVVAELEQYQWSEPGVCVHAGPDNIGQMCCITDSTKKPEMISWEDLARRIYGRVCDNPDEVGDYPSNEYQNRIASVLKAVESDFKKYAEATTADASQKSQDSKIYFETLNQLVAAANKIKLDAQSGLHSDFDYQLKTILAKDEELRQIQACKPLSPEELERKFGKSPEIPRSPIPAVATNPAPGPGLARDVASNSPAQITYPSATTGSANSTPSVMPAPKSYEEAFGREVGKDILNWMGVSSAPTPSEPDYFTAMQSLLGSSASAPQPNAMQPAAITPKITSNVTEKPLESSSDNASSINPTESEPTPSSTDVAKSDMAATPIAQTPKANSSTTSIAPKPTQNATPAASAATAATPSTTATTAESENDRTARFRSVKHYWEQDQASGNRKLADAIKGLPGVDDLAGKNSDSTGKDFQNLLVKNNPSSVLNTLLASSDFTEIPRSVGEKKGVIHPDAPNKTGSAESLAQTSGEIVRSLRQGGGEGRYALNGNRNNAEASNLRTLRTPGGRLVTDGGISQNAGASYNPNDTFSYASNAIYGQGAIAKKISLNNAFSNPTANNEFPALGVPNPPPVNAMPAQVAPNVDLLKQIKALQKELDEANNDPTLNETPSETELRELWEKLTTSFSDVTKAVKSDFMKFAEKITGASDAREIASIEMPEDDADLAKLAEQAKLQAPKSTKGKAPAIGLPKKAPQSVIDIIRGWLGL